MYPPSALLRSGGLDPGEVAARLGLESVDSIPVRPAPRWMVALWRGPVAGMTLPGAIYLRPDVLTGDPRRRAALVVHELVHARQWRELGRAGFLRRYVAGYLRGRRAGLAHDAAYRAIPLEQEAEAAAVSASGAPG